METCERTPSTTRRRRSSRTSRAGFLNLNDWIARAEVIDVSKLSGDKVVFVRDGEAARRRDRQGGHLPAGG